MNITCVQLTHLMEHVDCGEGIVHRVILLAFVYFVHFSL